MSIFKIKNRKEVFAWSLYDFANQPFTTIIVTFIYSAFFVKVIAANEQEGTFLWSMAISITAIVVALLSPILGALADRGGYRKFFLIASTWICAIFSMLLYFPNSGDVFYALTFFIIANIAFELGSVFCNSYLPDLSSINNTGRISGYAWGLGFVGGLIALFFSFIFVVQPEKPIFNLDKLSPSNSIELKLDSICENRIYIHSTLDAVDVKPGMHLKLKEKNFTEEIVVLQVKDNYLEFSKVVDDLHYLNDKFELYGIPIWMPEPKGNYSILSSKNISFEIRIPVFSNGDLLGFSAYSEEGKIFLIDKDYCVKNNLDYDEISLISHKTTQNLRFVNILVGLWFLLFSIPTFLFVKDRKREKLNKQHIFSSFHSLKDTFKSIANYREIYRFLIARLFFNDGLITIFAMGGVYAVGTLSFTIEEVMMLGIVLNVCAAVGSFLFGYIEDKIGAKKVINISLIVLMIATFLAYYSPETNHPKELFWLAGILLGLMIGPNQSCSRSLMSRLTPKEKQNEFFGFFALTGKATSFLGPLLFGIISKFYSQQLALWVVIVLLLIGFVLYNRTDDKQADIN